MSRWSTWRRGMVQRRDTRPISLVLMGLLFLLAACGGGTTAHHSSATPVPTATPVVHGWSTIPSPGVGQEGNLQAVTAISATNGWAVGQFEGLDSLQRTLTERWDGSQWIYQPSPSPGQKYNILQAVSGSSASDVWAVGYETSTDNVNQPLIEHWDGNSWSVSAASAAVVAGTAGGELSGVAAISPSDVWAVGFATIPSTANQPPGQQPLIEHWNGSAWSVVNGASIPLPQNGSVAQNALNAITALSANNVWAVGADNSVAMGPQQALIEHWDGHTWTLVPGADPNTYGNALSGITAVSSNDIWAVGSGQPSIPFGCAAQLGAVIEHWNGTQWSSVPSPQPAGGQFGFSLASVAAVSSSDVWAVGGQVVYSAATGETIGPVAEHWNGSQWSLVSNPVTSTSTGLAGVAAAPGGSVLAVGQYEAANGPAATLAETASGGRLSVVASASPGTVLNSLKGVTAISPSDVWAVGNSADGTLAEHWNGTTWTVSTTPNVTPFDDRLNGVAGTSSGDVWAVGASGGAGASIEHWNGTQWAVVPASVSQYSSLSGVVALSASNAWAVGVGGGSGPLVEHWNGTTWSAVATPASAPGTYLSDDSLLGVAAASPNDIWAVGGNPPHNCGGQLPALIEHWNGSSWSVIPNLPQGVLYGVTVVSVHDVWAVGSGGNGALILHWDGKQWSSVPAAPAVAHTYPLLQSVAAHGANDVWAAGTVSVYNGTSSTQVVVQHWDGHAWSAVQVAAPGVADNALLGITSVADGEIWAVGEYDNNNSGGRSAQQALIEHDNP